MSRCVQTFDWYYVHVYMYACTHACARMHLAGGIWFIFLFNRQWGKQVFDTLPILQVFLLTKHVEVCNFFHHGYTSTVRDGI